MASNFRNHNKVSSGGWSRWGIRLAVMATAAMLLALVLPSSAFAISESFTPQKITTGAIQAGQQQVSGDRIVWQASDGTDLEIYTWTPSQGVVKLTNNSTNDMLPQVSGDRVVWQGSDGTDMEIYTWTPVGGIVKITDNSTNDTAPQISGDRIVWQGSDGTDSEIYTWTPADAIVQITDNTTNDTSPQVSGDRVVWTGYEGTDTDIFTWTPSDSDPVQVSTNTRNDSDPQVSGDRIAWVGYDGVAKQIFTVEMGGSIVQITSDEWDNSSPQVSGDTVVWSRDYFEVMMWTPTGGTQWMDFYGIDSAPQIDGDRIVLDSDYYVSSWRAETGPVLVAQGYYEMSNAQVSGDRVVWAQKSSPSGGFEIYTAAATVTPDPTITSVSPNSGLGTGGTTVTINGTGFSKKPIFSVTFDGKAAKSYTVQSDTKIVAVSPAHQVGTVQVKVTTRVGGTADTANDDFTYIASPGTSEAFKTMAIEKFTSDHNYSYAGSTSLALSGDRMVWDAYDGMAWQIYTWDPVAGTQKITTGSVDNVYPVVSGDRVAWTALNESTDDAQVFTWTPSGGTVQLTKPGQQGGYPDVSGDRVVWGGTDPSTGNDSEIFTWTPTAGTTAVTSNAIEDGVPVVSGDRIAWMAYNDTTGACDIMTWTPAGTVRLTNGRAYGFPDVSGNRVVWADGRDVYTWTPGAAAPQKLTAAGTFAHMWASVDGNRVVWTAYGPYGSAVYTWSPTGGLVGLGVSGVYADTPAVSGDRVVWSGYSSGYYMYGEIYSWTPGAGITMVSSGKGESYNPCVSGDRLAWLDDDGIDTTVMSALPVPTVTSITPNHGLPAGGNTVTINGSGFHGVTGASGVTFGGVDATSYTVNSSSKITAVVPAHAWGMAEVVVKGSEGSSPIAGPANDYLYSYPRFDQTDSRLRYTGTWATYYNASFSAGSYGYTKVVGATVTAAFNGTLFNWVGVTGPNMGKADVSVDGAAPVEVDLYSATPSFNNRIFTVDGLTSGAHTVRITCKGTKNTSATNTYINVDAVETDGSLATATYVEQNDVRLSYRGAWSAYGNAVFSGGSYFYSKSAGASVTVPFVGQKLDWVATMGPACGIANVSVDGKAPTKVDLYSAANQYRQTVFTTGTLLAGLHTVTISYDGTKNASASDTYINADAFQIVGAVATATRFDQTNARFVWTNTWTLGSGTYYFGGNHRYVNTPGASVRINFTGASLTYIAKKGPSMGKAFVSVDGGAATLVDLYNATTLYQQRVWSTGILALGNHYVTITWAGQKSVGSFGTTINIDAVDVLGTLIQVLYQ